VGFRREFRAARTKLLSKKSRKWFRMRLNARLIGRPCKGLGNGLLSSCWRQRADHGNDRPEFWARRKFGADRIGLLLFGLSIRRCCNVARSRCTAPGGLARFRGSSYFRPLVRGDLQPSPSRLKIVRAAARLCDMRLEPTRGIRFFVFFVCKRPEL